MAKKKIICSLSFRFIFAIKFVLVAKWTIHGRTFGRPVLGGCMARIWQSGDRISEAGIFIYPSSVQFSVVLDAGFAKPLYPDLRNPPVYNNRFLFLANAFGMYV